MFLAAQLNHRNLALGAIDQRKKLTFLGPNPAPAPACGRCFRPHRAIVGVEHGHAHQSTAAAVDLRLTADGRFRGDLGFERKRIGTRRKRANASHQPESGLYAIDQGQERQYRNTTACAWVQGRGRRTKWFGSVYSEVVMARFVLVE